MAHLRTRPVWLGSSLAASLVGASLLSGCGSGESGVSGLAGSEFPALVRIDAEPAGANCPGGGSAINVGRDRNKDDVLQDGEVDSTSYLCDAVSATMIEGSFTVTNSIDAAALVGITDITGDLIIDASGLQHIDLSSLQHVGGTIFVSGFSGTAIALPALTSVSAMKIGLKNTNRGADDATFAGPDATFAVSLPVLTAIMDSLDASSVTRLEAPLLATIGGDLVADASTAAGLVLPQLTSVGGVVQLTCAGDSLPLPQLASVGNLFLDASGSSLAALALPALTTVTGELRIFSRAGSLTSVALPALASAGSIDIAVEGNLAVAAPQLMMVAGSISVSGPISVDPLDAPRLTSVGGGLFYGGSAVTAFDLPALVTLGGTISVDPPRPFLGGDRPGIRRLNAPLLTAIHGSLRLSSSQAQEIAYTLPVLATITGDLLLQLDSSVARPVALPELTTVGGDLTAGGAGPETLDLGSLTTVGGSVAIEGSEHLTLIDLPALTSIGASLTVRANALLESFTAPLLTAIPGSLTLASAGAQDPLYALPGLTTITGALTLTLSSSVGRAFALPGLTTIGGDVAVGGAGPLTLGLAALGSIGGSLGVTGTKRLTSVDLGALTSIGEDLAVLQNESLTSLIAPQLTSVGGGSSVIGVNPQLPTCAAVAIAGQVGAAANVIIFSNDDSGTCPP